MCQIARITGSTAHAYLEYIQRNLPEGVAMEVTKVINSKRNIRNSACLCREVFKLQRKVLHFVSYDLCESSWIE